MVAMAVLLRIIGDGVNLGFGEAKYFTQLPDQRSIFERRVCTQKCRVSGAVLIKDILSDFVPVFPGKINVKIRRIFTIKIDEAFKIKIKFNLL